ncbi:MAG: hypothetical protein AABO58_19320 [Acidobacteriota bacterium]
MSKQINVNPAHYKTAGREPAEGSDGGDSGDLSRAAHLGKGKRRTQQELPGHKKEIIKKK